MKGRAEALELAALWLALMCVYWFTSPPDITFEDTALFAGACATLGLPHPPGYPAHTLYCAPFTALFHALGFPHARGAAFASSFDAAGACVTLAWLLNRMFGSRPASLLAAGLLGLSPQLWAQAVIPEVYALNLWVVVVTMAAVRFYAAGGSARWLLLLAFATGQGLAVHWPLYVLVYPAFLIWLAPHWRRLLRDALRQRTFLLLALAFLAGLSPYIHLVTVSPDSFRFAPEYGPDSFFAYVSREAYGIGGDQLGLKATVAAVATAAASFVPAFQYAFGLLAASGLALMAARRNWALLLAMLWGMALCLALLSAVRPYETTDAVPAWVPSVYPIQSHAFAAVALACAAAAAFRRLRLRDVAAKASVAAVLVAVAAAWWQRQDRSAEDLAMPHALMMLDSVPPGGLLVTAGSDFDFPVRYAHHLAGEGSAPELVTEPGYLSEVRTDGTLLEEDERRLVSEGREVAYMPPWILKTVGRRYRGLYSTVAPDLPPGAVEIDIDPAARDLLRRILDMQERGTRNAFTEVFLYGSLIGFVQELQDARADGAELEVEDELLLAEALRTPVGRYAEFMRRALDPDRPPALAELTGMLEEAAPAMPHLDPSLRADMLHLHSSALILSGDLEGGTAQLELALREFPSYSNAKVIVDLLQLRDAAGDYGSYRSLRRRFPGADVGTALEGPDARCEEALGAPCAVPLRN